MARLILPRYEGDMTLSKRVGQALQYLGSVRNYSPNTIDSYQRSFDQFHHFLHQRGLTDEVKHFNPDTVREFAEYLAGKGAKAQTVVIRLSALSSIANTLMKMKDERGRPILTSNPARTFEWPTVDQAETKFLLPDELRAFLSVERPLRESVARDLFIDTGLRVSELARANVGDVIEVGGQYSLAVTVKGKGTRRRKISAPLSSGVASAVVQWLISRGISNPQDPKYRDEPLLLNRDGERWKRSGLSCLMARIGKQAGISRFRVSAHKLRHTTNVVERFAGIDPLVRSKLRGHASTQSLIRYDHIIPGELHVAREQATEAMLRYMGNG